MTAQSAKAAVRAFFDAFNARDQDGIRRAMHFPHVRIASGRVRVTERREDFAVPFDRLAEGEGWDHSGLDEVEVVHDGPGKAHLAIAFTRYGADGEAYAAHRSLWVMAEIDGRWGVQARSSFAP